MLPLLTLLNVAPIDNSSGQYFCGAAIALFVLFYLIYSLFKPEKF